MFSKRFSLIWLLLASIATTPLQANPEEELIFNIQFKILGLETAAKDLVYFTEGQRKPVEFFFMPSFLSPEYEYTGPSPLVFYRPTNNEEEPYQPVAKLEIQPGQKNLLLFFIQNQAEPGRPEYTVTAFNFGKEAFPLGSYYLFNLTPYPIGAVLGKTRDGLMPNQSKIITPDPGEERLMRAEFYAYDNDRGWRQKAISGWPHRDNQRVITILFINDDRRESLRIHSVIDYPAYVRPIQAEPPVR
jgi:hypothetical protein